MDDSDRSKPVPIADLKIRELAEDLADSAPMKPYVDLAAALLQGSSSEDPVARIAELPLEQRYVWRVASALE